MKHYVYTLAYPDGTVFYVGKGTGDRINAHERQARKGKASPRYDIIRSIWEQGDNVVKMKVHETDDEEEAYRKEVALIRQYGLDNLANRVDYALGPRSTSNGTGIQVNLYLSAEEMSRIRMLLAKQGKDTSDFSVIAFARESSKNGVRLALKGKCDIVDCHQASIVECRIGNCAPLKRYCAYHYEQAHLPEDERDVETD